MTPANPPPGISRQQHVANTLRALITGVPYPPGSRLPSETALADEFEYNRTTIRRALALLRAEGMIEVVNGVGAFVRRRRLIHRELRNSVINEYLKAVGGGDGDDGQGLFELSTGTPGRAVDVTWEYANVEADEDLAEEFGINPGALVVQRTYRFRVDGRLHQIAVSYLPGYLTEKAPHLLDPANEHEGRGVMLQLREAGALPKVMTEEIETRPATPEESAELDTEGWVMVRRRRLYAGRDARLSQGKVVDGRCVELATGITPARDLVLHHSIDFRREAQA